ncbi:hypothetical protein EVG20_g6236 [Dentipellis fragilis]|uniref:Uncharacterized protein n=1 Tax=Dentipellis fragilis TaxID=205917 RepID=A0A4Y9YMA3_9AGAM|nr:hypothetical protein EVG20_g6236 [Dentipellis fragilis]
MSSVESESDDMEVDPDTNAALGGTAMSAREAEFAKIRRDLQAEVQAARHERDAAIQELVAERNTHAHTVEDLHGHHGRRSHKENMAEGQERAKLELLARKFCLMRSFWLRDVDATFSTPVNPSYVHSDRFSSAATRIQGQIADLMEILPSEYRTRIRLKAWMNAWVMAMQQQRSNSVSRVRECALVIFSCKADELSTTTARLARFKVDIGYTTHSNGKGYYKAMAPILYKNYNGSHDSGSIFLNPQLLLIFAVLVHGPSALKDVGSHGARGHTVYTLWKLHKITAGAIAACAILARFVLSADSLLETEGQETGIRYQDDFDTYLQYLTTGLEERRPSVLAILRLGTRSSSPTPPFPMMPIAWPMKQSTLGQILMAKMRPAAVLAALRNEHPVALESEDSEHAVEPGKRTRSPTPEHNATSPPSKRAEVGEAIEAAPVSSVVRATKQRRRKRR